MAVSDEGIQKLAENRTIATLLPGTTFFLGKSGYAPYLKLKEAGVDVALATDFNPGSCYIQSMPFILSLSFLYQNHIDSLIDTRLLFHLISGEHQYKQMYHLFLYIYLIRIEKAEAYNVP